MKTTLMILSLTLLTITNSFAQKEDKNTIEVQTKQQMDSINRWTIEMLVGQAKGLSPYADGYYSSNPNKLFGTVKINSFDLGVRYMFSPKYGLKLDVGYEKFKNITNTSFPFETYQYRVDIQGVANAKRLFGMEDVSKKWGMLIHAGGQVSRLTSNTPNIPGKEATHGLSELNGGLIYGFTPQYRITSTFAVMADVSVLTNYRQHLNWDGSRSVVSNNLSGQMVSATIGLSISLGKKDLHGDWAIIPDQNKIKAAALENRIGELETMMNDSDKDGVPDYLDTENKSIAGVAVDTKGRMVDFNKNNIPDELENYINQKYESLGSQINTLKMGDNNTFVNSQMKNMINGSYVNVFFDFDKTTVSTGTISAINFLIKYMNANPESKIQIIGYADEIGSKAYNLDLAERRAKVVKEVIVKSGISASRLTLVIKGIDNSVPKNSPLARQLVRRVAFVVE